MKNIGQTELLIRQLEATADALRAYVKQAEENEASHARWEEAAGRPMKRRARLDLIPWQGKVTGAARRSTMDATRALAEWRKS